ncbi:MAG TPA: tripartite tricarboxylate transporter substrate-binding protein [Burkholderiales bacterium]|nr:tripartite tricarboxylate transporter substrate-binding protein [Burkholderiales bacterium]
MPRVHRRLVALLLALAGSAFGQAGSAVWPAKPVRVVVPFPPGGGAEAAARFLANDFAQAFGQPFLIDNRPGGNTVIGAEAVAKAAPDGYTLLLTGGSTMSVQPLVFAGRLPFDPLADFAPVSMVSHFPFFIFVPASVPANTLPELVAYVKARPGQLSYASNGSGTMAHLGMEMLKQSTGMDLLHVPYKGFGLAMPDLLSGRVTVMMADLAPVGSQVKAGALRALAATSLQRSSFLPDVPTVAELGNPGYEIDVWFGLFAPARTPPGIIARLNAEARKYLDSAEAKEAYGKVGHEAISSTPEAVRARIAAEQKTFAKAVKNANLKPE